MPHTPTLEGQWQLLSLNDSNLHEQRYWRLQLGYWQPFAPQAPQPSDRQNIIARYELRGDSLHLFSPYLIRRDLGQDSLITPDRNIDLRAAGILRFPTAWRVVHLSTDKLYLKNDTQTLRFRKF